MSCILRTGYTGGQRSRVTIRLCRTTDSDVTIGHRVVSDRNLACAYHIRHKTLSDAEVIVLFAPIATVLGFAPPSYGQHPRVDLGLEGGGDTGRMAGLPIKT